MILLSFIIYIICIQKYCTKADINCSWPSILFGDSCYLISTESSYSFAEAEAECKQKYNGELANVPDSETNDFLKKLILRTIHSGYWIGISKYVQGNTTSCPAFFLKSYDCLSDHLYICQYNESNSECKSNNLKFGHHCYNLSREVLWFQEAEQSCGKQNGKLVEIESNEQVEFLKHAILSERWWLNRSLYENYYTSNYKRYLTIWLGIRRYEKNIWLDSKNRSVNFKDWKANEQKYSEGKHCAEIQFEGWGMQNCQAKGFYICQTEALVASGNDQKEYIKNKEYIFYIVIGTGSIVCLLLISITIFILVKRKNKKRVSLQRVQYDNEIYGRVESRVSFEPPSYVSISDLNDYECDSDNQKCIEQDDEPWASSTETPRSFFKNCT